MYFELLALEIHATMAGLKVVKPSICEGDSGVAQRFSFLAVDWEGLRYAFDIYDEVNEEKMMRTYLKKMDAKANVFIVSLRGKPSPDVATMADEYGITILGPADIGGFFEWLAAEARVEPKAVG